MSDRDDRAFIEDMLARLALIAAFTKDGCDAHVEVPWRQIAAFRNFVIHVYWDIKLERIWEIVENDLPVLKPQLEAILARLPNDE